MALAQIARSLGLAITVTVCLAADVGAQMTDSERSSLSRALQPGDAVIVTLTDGREAKGTWIGLQTETLRLVLDGRAQELPLGEVRAIEKRGDPLLNGALIGAAVLGLPMAAGAGASCSPDCGSAVGGTLVLGSAIGAALGGFVDMLVEGRRLVYDASPVRLPRAEGVILHPTPAVPTVPSAAPPPEAVPVSHPATENPAEAVGVTHVLSEIGSRIHHRQPVSVTLVNGGEVTGRFFSASDDSLTVLVKDVPRAVAAHDIVRVRIKSSRTGEGMMLGAIVLGGVGLATSAVSDGAGGAAVGAAFGGSLWGALIGSRLAKYQVVYER